MDLFTISNSHTAVAMDEISSFSSTSNSKKSLSSPVDGRLNQLNGELVAFLQHSGYEIIQSNGQRVYAPRDAPDAGENDDQRRTRGCEVFVGRIPRDMFEDELVPLFETVGRIHKLRLMMDFTGKNRGFAFVTYLRPDVACEAVTRLHNREVRAGRRIGVYKSVDNCRLFVGGLPVDKQREEIEERLCEYVEGIVDVIMYKSHWNPEHNRGFAFVDFADHRQAAMARRRLSPGSLILWGSPIMVDWAEPLPDVDPEIMQVVTILYIRNINVGIGREEFRSFIGRYINTDNVVRLHKTLDYAFVHFASRATAEEAMNILKNSNTDLEVMWARPNSYSKSSLIENPPQHFCTSLPPKTRRYVQGRVSAMKNYRSAFNCSNDQLFQQMTMVNPSTSQPSIPTPPEQLFPVNPLPKCICGIQMPVYSGHHHNMANIYSN